MDRCCRRIFRTLGIPNCLGRTIDGKHIKLKYPQNSDTSFWYKICFSIVLLAAVDPYYKCMVEAWQLWLTATVAFLKIQIFTGNTWMVKLFYLRSHYQALTSPFFVYSWLKDLHYKLIWWDLIATMEWSEKEKLKCTNKQSTSCSWKRVWNIGHEMESILKSYRNRRWICGMYCQSSMLFAQFCG